MDGFFGIKFSFSQKKILIFCVLFLSPYLLEGGRNKDLSPLQKTPGEGKEEKGGRGEKGKAGPRHEKGVGAGAFLR